jgi:hypothetical protein
VHRSLGFFFRVPILEKSFTGLFMGLNSNLSRPMEIPRWPCDSDFEFGNTDNFARLDHGSPTALIFASDGDRRGRANNFPVEL